MPPLWVQKSSTPTLMGAFRACKTPFLWVQIFQKQGLSSGMSAETRSTEELSTGISAPVKKFYLKATLWPNCQNRCIYDNIVAT